MKSTISIIQGVLPKSEIVKLNTPIKKSIPLASSPLPEILFITTFPPRECGIATYSQDLIKALTSKFGKSFKISICALENNNEVHEYKDSVKYCLNTDKESEFTIVQEKINKDEAIAVVLMQHEFGIFENNRNAFIQFVGGLSRPLIMVFHTVLPGPDQQLKNKVTSIAAKAASIIVMTQSSRLILKRDYNIPSNQVTVIPHGTHLVPHTDKNVLKEKYGFTGRTILSTFGLLSSGKGITTTLDALPAIIKNDNSILFLIIGKTHPNIVKNEGEVYREMLQAKVEELHLQKHVVFINYFLALPELLEYLQMTDVYLFTSMDPNQAVSGTFAYALSSGCPIVSTPIPHACEVLGNDAGIIVDFNNSTQLADAVNKLLADQELMSSIVFNALHRMAETIWENAAIAHAMLIQKTVSEYIPLHYALPAINLEHVKKMTTNSGMLQFSRLNQPDFKSGYTLDDNARALIAMCQYFELTNDVNCLPYIETYLNFIQKCQQASGNFLNYVDADGNFTEQNYECNLEDSNGRAIWALGYFISKSYLFSLTLVLEAEETMQFALGKVDEIHSARAMAFIIKGIHFYQTKLKSKKLVGLISKLTDRLVQMYLHEAKPGWEWFESYLTYGNSVLPEALLCAWETTGKPIYKEIAIASFDFLISKTMPGNRMKAISNKNWLDKMAIEDAAPGGEQPIEIAYTILALYRFEKHMKNTGYGIKIQHCFNWFLGDNHLGQIVYNPCTGGCYDGLEQHNVNLNQGAESTLSYLMARLVVEKRLETTKPVLRKMELVQ